MEILENIKVSVENTTIWEWFAVIAGLLYVILITFKKTAAWFFAVVSSGLYIYLCYISQLYLETGLQVFYLAMGFYGWYMWTEDEKDDIELITVWSLKQHLLNILISGILMLVFGHLFDNYTSQANPYTDAFTTIFSLTATFMVTRKILENWVYWIVIDTVSVYLFFSRELYMTSLLFVIYTIIAVFGYVHWSKLYKAQEQ